MMNRSVLRALRIVAVLAVAVATPHVRAGASTSSTSHSDSDSDSLRRALETVLQQNKEMERHMRELSQQNSEYVTRLSALEQTVRHQQHRNLPQAQLAVMPGGDKEGPAPAAPTVDDDDFLNDDGGVDSDPSAGITTTIGESTTYAQAQANAASIKGLEKNFFDFKKRIRQRVRRNRDACGQVRDQATKASTTINRIDKKVGKLQDSVESSYTDIQVLNGVVDAQTLRLQQLGKEGPFQSASTSEDGSAGQASLASLNEGLARIAALEDQVNFLTKKTDRQQKKIKDQEDAINQLVITSVSSVDPAMAAVMSNFASSLNETQGDLEDVDGRVATVEKKLDLMLESLINMNNGTMANESVTNLSYEEKLAILSSVVKSNSQRIEKLENSTDVSELELAVASLVGWVNETTTDISELYDMVTELADEHNSTTTTNVTAATNNATFSLAEVNATLPPATANATTNATTGLDVQETLQDVLARLTALESLVDYDGEDSTGNETVNVTDVTNTNSSDTNTTASSNTTATSMSLGSFVFWMRSEIRALTLKVQGQEDHLTKTDNDVTLLFDTLYYEPIPSNATGENATTGNASHTGLISRLDELELAVQTLEDEIASGARIVESPPVDANLTVDGNITIDENATLPLPEPAPGNFTSEYDLLLSRIEALESEIYMENSTDSRIDVLEMAYTELELAMSAEANATAGVDDLKNLSARLDALTGMNASQLTSLLDRMDDSEAMIEDLAGVIDDVNASFAAIATLVNTTAEHSADLDSIVATLANLTAAATDLDRRLDVQEDELADYQEATDQALMTLQGSFRELNTTGSPADDGQIQQVLQLFNVTTATVSDLEAIVSAQSKKLKTTVRQVEDMASQLDTISILGALVGNLTATVKDEISSVNEGLDMVEELAQETAQSLANLTSRLEQSGSGARR